MSENFGEEVMESKNYIHKKFHATTNNIRCIEEENSDTEISRFGNELLIPIYTRQMQSDVMDIKEENSDTESLLSDDLNNTSSNIYDACRSFKQESPLDLTERLELACTPTHQPSEHGEQSRNIYKMEYIRDFNSLSSCEDPLRSDSLLDLNTVHRSLIAPLTIDVVDDGNLSEELHFFMNLGPKSWNNMPSIDPILAPMSDYTNGYLADKSNFDFDDGEKKQLHGHDETDTPITGDVIEAAFILLRLKNGVLKRSQSKDMNDQEPPQKKCKMN